MSLLTFPANPYNGQPYPDPPVTGQNLYVWSSSDRTWRLVGTATGVAAGTYGNSNNVGQFTVDAAGNITYAANVPIAGAAGGTVTQIDTGTGLTGGPITGTGTVALLPATASNLGGVIPDGTVITVDPAGTINLSGTFQSSLLPDTTLVYDLGSPTQRWRDLYLSNNSIYLDTYKVSVVGGQLSIDGTSVSGITSLTAGTGLSGGTITTSGTIDLANTAVTAGSYTYGSFTVDPQGRLTAASSGTAPITSVSVTSPITSTGGTTPTIGVDAASTTLSGVVQLNDAVTSTSTTQAATANAVKTAYDLAAAAMPLSGGVFTGGVTFNTSPTFSPGVDIGPAAQVSYASTSGLTAVNVQDALDELATNACQGTVTSVTAGTGLSGGTITSTGTIALANTAVTAGTYTNATVTVDAQGRLTSASSGSTSSGTVTSVTAGTGLSGGTITASGTIALADTAVTAGSYTYGSFTVDAQGRLTTASSNTSPITCQDFEAKGDLLVGYGADSFGVETVGANDTVLMADSTCASGLKWQAITQCQGTVTCIGTSFGLCPTTITDSGLLRLANASSMGIGGVYGCTNASNTALGLYAFSGNPGGDNVAIGYQAMGAATIGGNSIAIGSNALCNGGGDCNIAIGFLTLLSAQSTARANMALGHGAGLNISSGVGNIGIGYQALLCTTTGGNNVEIGSNNFTTALYDPPFVITTQCNRVVMGSKATTNAYIQVGWTTVSDVRDKTEVTALPVGLDFITQLEPISYRFKESRDSDVAVGQTRYGFSAQDVLKIEGESSVIVDTEDPDKLKITDSNLIPVLVQAIKELKTELDDLKARFT